VALGLVGGYFLLPSGGWAQTIWAVLVGWTAVGAIVVAMRRYRPAAPVAWACFAAGLFLNATGQLVEAILARVSPNASFPTLADVFYLALYVGLVAGLVVLIRGRRTRRDWAAMLDASTISTGLGLLSWVFLIRPAGADTSLSLLGRAVNVAYPVGDLLVLAVLVRLLLDTTVRNHCVRLMTVSLGLFLAGDVAWAAINQLGWTPGSVATRLLSMDFLAAYVIFGAAALHPGMRDVAQGQGAPARRVSARLLALLTIAALVAPAVLGVEVARGKIADGVAIVVGSVALFLLVIGRMAQLLGQVADQAERLRALSLVDELTGLPNRRSWSATLSSALERARREHQLLTIAMIDLDHFKAFNDDFGHQAGDRFLKGAGAAWRDELRAVDALARYGGEEFIVLLPGASAEDAVATMARMRAVTPAGQSFSAGVATWEATECDEELIARADLALYAAKDAGRDTTVVAPSEPLALAVPLPY
jgi:diguanylate cyclase (GGDEF)-like protein